MVLISACFSTVTVSIFYLTGIYEKSNLKYIVLDEADSLFDDSFNELTLRLIKKLKVSYVKTHYNPNDSVFLQYNCSPHCPCSLCAVMHCTCTVAML